MNAEAMIGTVLGNCKLQQLIGRGSLGAAYLAQQAHPLREVVVKIFLPETILSPQQQEAFRERFRREAKVVSSLKHPNILSIYEYGEQDGVAYQIMPYMSNGTLRDVMKREGPLPLLQILKYLDQLASALDYAHSQGVIHRDIKPTNILLTSNDSLLLSDFGLVKLIMEDQEEHTFQKQLTGPGTSMGTPDYMAPEQIRGEQIDGRVDLYSLGVVLYQMVTGRTPFQGKTNMQIAAKHLHVPPPSPRSWRADLPVAAEQVMMRALAKHPDDRYMRAQDLATAFRLTLTVTQAQLDSNSNGAYRVEQSAASSSGLAATSFSTDQGRFDTPRQQKAMVPVGIAGNNGNNRRKNGIENLPYSPALNEAPLPRRIKMEHVSPTINATSNAPTSSTFKRKVLRREDETGALPAVRETTVPEASPPLQTFPGANAVPEAPVSQIFQTEPMEPSTTAMPWEIESNFPTPTSNITGGLSLPGYVQGNTGSIKLTESVKVVQVPVAGQPGQFVTGLLPVTHRPPSSLDPTTRQNRSNKSMKIVAGAIALLLVVLLSGTFWFVHSHSLGTKKHKQQTVIGNIEATATAKASAAPNPNIILIDPLSQNIHNWPVSLSGTKLYVFENGAYHITDNDPTQGAPALLPDQVLTTPFGYTLTMEEIKGDDASSVNSFGMIIRSNTVNKGGRMITTFYSFEVVNKKGGEYQFWKYDNSRGASVKPWTELWHHAFGSEFHVGHGPKSINTFKIFANGKKFTLIVNGKQIAMVQDASFASGGIGMLVNLKGTEVAFSNLKLTYN